MIFEDPEQYNSTDFKVILDPAHVQEVRDLYALPTDPVFQLVPPAFRDLADLLYWQMGHPLVIYLTAWAIYADLLNRIRTAGDAVQFQDLATDYSKDHSEWPGFSGDAVDALNLAPVHGDNVVGSIPGSTSNEADDDDGYYSSDASLLW
ncbi:hypothetical protein WOLCODRAFT_164380 [Wolfiporia cocos MD-104 SS10]|uniref:Uncharacterized protein n=1 Tax=Wolfiporia cocos (strain MD-104) TaxID=742152 RepID=A0A2H3JME4_WOLCO|nr:hypothetical protein WOLCODRAFT_164380 [Wolfiporia cocos MD-104 SS10]